MNGTVIPLKQDEFTHSTACYEFINRELIGFLTAQGWTKNTDGSIFKDDISVKLLVLGPVNNEVVLITINHFLASRGTRQFSLVVVADNSKKVRPLTKVFDEVLFLSKYAQTNHRMHLPPREHSPNWYIEELGFLIMKAPGKKTNYARRRIIFDRNGQMLCKDLSREDEEALLVKAYIKLNKVD